jgi:hypothetical protein
MDEDDGPATASHPVERPTLKTARTALERLYGPHIDDVWRTLLFRAGLTGNETDRNSFDHLVSCMATAEPITRLCARSLAVRAATYARLTAAAPMEGRAA